MAPEETPPVHRRRTLSGSAASGGAVVRSTRAGGSGKARQESLREHNLALVTGCVFDAEVPLSRAEVAARTGLTRATVSSLVDRLITGGILAELEPTVGAIGRPATPLVPAAGRVCALGLEVNVGYVGACVLDLSREVLARRVTAADLRGSQPETVMPMLAALARECLDQVGGTAARIVGGGLALPGLVDTPTGTLRVAPNLGWQDTEPLAYLSDLGVQVTVGNEANLSALAQLGVHGVPSGMPRSFVYVSAEVGVGGAIVIDGEIFGGVHGWAGEIGHVCVDPNGPACRCGSRGCLEQYAGRDALLAGAGLPLTAPIDEVAVRLRAGDPRAREAVEVAGRALATALGSTINLVDVDAVVLGGIFMSFYDALARSVTSHMPHRVLAERWTQLTVQPPVVVGATGMTGAALAVLRRVAADPAGVLARG